MKQAIDVIMNTVYMKITDRETEMNTEQETNQQPTEQEPKANPYFGRKCFRTGK